MASLRGGNVADLGDLRGDIMASQVEKSLFCDLRGDIMASQVEKLLFCDLRGDIIVSQVEKSLFCDLRSDIMASQNRLNVSLEEKSHPQKIETLNNIKSAWTAWIHTDFFC